MLLTSRSWWLLVSLSLAVNALATAEASVSVGGTIDVDTTWTAANSPYIVTSDIVVAGDPAPTLTIEAGVTVRFGAGTALLVGTQAQAGALVAEDSSGTQPILFTSDQITQNPGDWRGIAFSNLARPDLSRLEGCEIEYAGGSAFDSLQIRRADIPLIGVKIRSYASVGLYVSGADITIDGLEVSGSSGDDAVVVGNQGSLVLTNPLIDGAGASGVVCSEASVLSISGGQLSASTAHGVHLVDCDAALDGVDIQSPGLRGVFVDGTSSLALSNSTVAGNLFVQSIEAIVTDLAGNTFPGYSSKPARVPPDQVDDYFLQNVVQGAQTGDPVEVAGGVLTETVTWGAWLGLIDRYRIASDLLVGGTPGMPAILTVPSGITFDMAAYARLQVGSDTEPAGLVLNGALGAPIVFQPWSTVYSWGGVHIHSGAISASTALDYVDFVGSGADGVTPALGVENQNLAIQGITVTGSDGPGLRFDGGSYTLTDLSVMGTAGYGMWLGIGSFTLNQIDIENTGGTAGLLVNQSAQVNADATRVATAGGNGVQVYEGATLTADDLTVDGTAGFGVLVSDASLTLTNSQILAPASWGVQAFGGTALSLQNSTVENNLRFDPDLTGVGLLAGNTFTNYSAFPARLPPDLVDPYFADNSVTGVLPGDLVEVAPGLLTVSSLWGEHAGGAVNTYRMLGDVTIVGQGQNTTTLTLRPDTRMRFAANASLTVGRADGRGALSALGGPATRIRLEPDAPGAGPGWWRGLHLTADTQAALTELDWVFIERAGGGGTAALRVDAPVATLSNLLIRNSEAPGVEVRQAEVQIRDSRVDSTQSGAGIVVGAAGRLGLANVRVVNAGAEGIRLDGASLTLGQVSIEDPGAEGILVSDGEVTGTEVSIIAPVDYGLRVAGPGTVSFIDSLIEGSLDLADPAAAIGTFHTNVIDDVSSHPPRIPAEAVQVLLEDNTLQGTQPGDVVRVHGGTLDGEHAWAPAAGGDVATLEFEGGLVVTGPTDAPAVLELAPGLELRFPEGERLEVGSGAASSAILTALGTEQQPIRFGPTTANGWGGLRLTEGSGDGGTRLEHVVVDRAGDPLVPLAAVEVDRVNPVLEHVSLQDVRGVGLLVSGPEAQPEITFISASGGAGNDVEVEGDARPTLHQGDLAAAAALAAQSQGPGTSDFRETWWGDPSGPGGAGPGAGEDVSQYVGYEGWLETPPETLAQIRDSWISGQALSPTGGSVSLRAGFSEPANWTAEIRDGSSAVRWTRTGAGTSVDLDWNGEDDTTTALPDGTYVWRIEATTIAGGAAAAPVRGDVNVDAALPYGAIVSPRAMSAFSPGDLISVTGTADGAAFASYDLEFGVGLYPESFNVLASDSNPVTDGLLGTLDTSPLPGGWIVFRLLVHGTDASTTEIRVPVKLLGVGSLEARRPVFSPDGNGRGDRCVILARLDSPSSWTLNVKDAGDQIIRTFQGSGRFVSAWWDGTDDGGSALPEGDYSADLVLQEGSASAEFTIGGLAIDLTPPTAEITSPEEGEGFWGLVDVRGTADDLHAGTYRVEHGLGDAPVAWTVIASSSASVIDGTLGLWDTSTAAQTNRTLRLLVEDAAGNQAEARVGVWVVDTSIVDTCSTGCPAPPAIDCSEQNPCDVLDPGDRCPTGTDVTDDVLIVEPTTNTFSSGERLLVSRTRQGQVVETQQHSGSVCESACYTDCHDNCVRVPIVLCYEDCVLECANGLCINWDVKCDLAGWQQVCDTECCVQCELHYDEIVQTSYFNRQCGFDIESTVELRHATGACSGGLIETHQLGGLGTATASIPAPLEAGDYELCAEGAVIKAFTVVATTACRLEIGQSVFSLPEGVDQALPVSLTTTDDGEYLLSLQRYENDAHTINLPLPAFLSAPVSVTGVSTAPTPFTLDAVNPVPEGTRIHWANVILRAEGPATCEAVFDVDVVPIECGNGMLELDEECDDGNTDSCDGCSDQCRIEVGFVCGDGTILPGCEECDHGGDPGFGGCDSSCTLSTCGNGVIEGIEQCDDGNQNSCDGCSSICRNEPGFECGDGLLNTSCGEECDDGNRVDGDFCDANCISETPCGDGITEGVEQCDDENTASCDGCSSLCVTETGHDCGDGEVNSACGEECDDGGNTSGDGCDAFCKLETCGNGVIDPPETCDDDNRRSCDGCSSLCQDETGFICGDGETNLACGEECDDANAFNDDACTVGCLDARCGDGHVRTGVEQCDDGPANSDTAPDACRTDCTPARCGDGTLDTGEQCDDGPANSDTAPDACRTDCTPARCGDGAIDTDEECDDGNTVSGDDCSSTCFSELPRVIIVPGILASVLEMQQTIPSDTDIKWIDLGILLPGILSDFNDLAVPGHSSDPNCNLPGCIDATSIFACPNGNCEDGVLPLLDFYGDLWSHLESNGFYVEPFAYDWRWDLEEIADRLHGFLLDPDHNPTGNPVNIVSHSLGTAVTRRLVVDLATGQYPGTTVQVSNVVYLAPPFSGTPMAVQPIITGQMDASGALDLSEISADDILDLILDNSDVVSIGRTWPSVYQMLPMDGFYANDSTELATCTDLGSQYPSDVWVWDWSLIQGYHLNQEPGFDVNLLGQHAGFLANLRDPVPDAVTREAVIASYQVPTPECAQPVGCRDANENQLVCADLPLESDRNRLASIFKIHMACGDWRMTQKTVAGLGSAETSLFLLEESCPAGFVPRRSSFDRTRHSKISGNLAVLDAVEQWFNGVDDLTLSRAVPAGCQQEFTSQPTHVDGDYRIVSWDGTDSNCDLHETVLWAGRPLSLRYVDSTGGETSRTERDDTGVVWLGFPDNEYLFGSGYLEGTFFIDPEGNAGETGFVHVTAETPGGLETLSAFLLLDGDGTPWTLEVSETGELELQRDIDGDGTPDDIVVLAPDADEDGVPDISDNCGSIYNPGQVDLDQDGAGDRCDLDDDNDTVPDTSDNCPRDFNPQQDDADGDGPGNACDPDDDNDSILDDGDGSGVIGDAPCTSGATSNCDDNCQFVANPDQADGNGNGQGTLCDTVCRLVVGAPGPPATDYATIEDALAAVTPGPPPEFVATDRCVIELLPGTYAAPLTLDRYVSLVAVDTDPAATVIDAVGSSTAITIPDREVPGRIDIVGVTVRNAVDGIDTHESISLRNSVVEGVSGLGVRLGIGVHYVDRVAVVGGAAGIVLSPFGSVIMDGVSVTGTSGHGIDLYGDAVIRNGVIADNTGSGIVAQPPSTLQLSFSTVAGNGVGLDSRGPVLQVNQSIVCNNSTDLVGVTCASFTMSDVCGTACTGLGGLDCTGADGNISVDPGFVDSASGDYHLSPASPAVDAGFAPECFTGVPCHDVEGNPRLLDADGDGEPRPDLGAFELGAATQGVPGIIGGVRVDENPDQTHELSWDPDPGSNTYRVYQGLLSEVRYDLNLQCVLTTSQTTTTLPPDVPAPGDGFFYLVAGSDAIVEGTLGFGTCAERSRTSGPCP